MGMRLGMPADNIGGCIRQNTSSAMPTLHLFPAADP